MALSRKLKNVLAAPFAVSYIMDKFMVPGIVGAVVFAVGRWQGIEWLQIVGAVLAAPIAWVYAVVIFVLFPFAIFDSIRRKIKARLHKTK